MAIVTIAEANAGGYPLDSEGESYDQNVAAAMPALNY